MTKRPAFPHIGWDPTPGDVEQTRDLAKQLGKLASELGTSLSELQRIECGAWKGKTAVAFTEHISTDVTPLIKKSHDSFDKASRALHRWAGELKDFQDEADRLEKTAGDKLKDLSDANAKHPDDLSKEGQAVNDVEGKVDDLQSRYNKAAGAISKELDKAGDIAPDEPGFWDKLVHGVEDAWNATGKWIKDHADLIKLIGDVLSDLTGVLAFLALVTLPFEPLGAIFGAAAILTSGLALLSHSIAKAAGADVSWMSIGFDALGLLPGIGAFGKDGVAVAKTANAAREAKILGPAFKSLGARTARNLVSFGEDAGEVVGGKSVSAFGKSVALWGEKPVQLIGSESTKLNRLGGVLNAGYRQGQTFGTKAWNILAPERMAVDPMGNLGRGIDATLKIAPKAWSIPQHIGEAVHLGDRLHHSTSH
ncbi:enoyl-CoA hydratase/isomerase family protein [Streptomyces sp. NBC_00963]|uniref:putative T7SS-secreted protein n=1 Tax=Streptomyces sp. NBC_00963 TaxID=2903697 RepID=UPI00386CF236|nr:enoyl-CoA hydratase/isomerase family protein [Streptomyces sp. NBC_00963]